MIDRNYKILMILLALTIIGEVASIAIWYSQPDMRMTLIVDYTTASVVSAVAAVLNIVAFIGVLRKSKWGYLLVIAVSIPNRILDLFLFESPASTSLFALWTALLVIFVYINYKGLIMPNNFLSFRDVIRYARNQKRASNSLREALGLDRGNLHLQAKHFPFSVLIYNMALLPWPAPYKGTNRSGAISELINRIKADPPDVVGLCEVFVDSEKETIRNNLSHIYKYYNEGPDEDSLESDGGLLILSKHAIVTNYQSIYRECAGPDCLSEKGAIYLRIFPSNRPTPCDIFFSHTQNMSESGGINALYAQLTHLGCMIRAYSDPHTPTFVMGDLNVPAEVEAHYNQLIGRLRKPVDLWHTKYPSKSGFTSIIDSNFYKNPDEAPSQNKRLDYILTKAGLRFVPILKNIEILKWTHKGRQISDHFGLRARFEQLLEIGIRISGIISKVTVTIPGFRCIETTSGPGSDEVSFTVRIYDPDGRTAESSTKKIEDVDTSEYHVVNMTPATLQGDPGAYVRIEVEGKEHDSSSSNSLGKEFIQISRMDLLLNKGRSFNRVTPFLTRDGEYSVDINVFVA